MLTRLFKHCLRRQGIETYSRVHASKEHKIEDKEDVSMTTTQKATQFGMLQIAIILLTVATAFIHLVLGIPNNLPMFILNGIGYLVLVVALYLPQLRQYQSYTRWALIAFTAVTVLGWVFIGERNMIAYLDKIIEMALIVCLFLEGRR
jgi:phosphate/sulfate permease